MSREASEPIPPPSQPQPLNGLTLKVASGCNILCEYGGEFCFEYPDGPDTWSGLQPGFMSEEVMKQTAAWLGEYASAQNLNKVSVVLHGGEPLRWGTARIDECAKTFRETLAPREVQFGIQTNGTLLATMQASDILRASKKREKKEPATTIMEVLQKYDFRIGVSLDGDQAANDRHRLDFAGQSTYGKVLEGINLLQKTRLRWGLLAVIDLANDPLETYDALTAHKPPLGIDFILPLGNHDNPPPGRDKSDATPYGDWLGRVWERYIHAATTMPFSVRKFDSLTHQLQGNETLTEVFGNPEPRQLFVRPNGGIYGLDTYTYMGAETSALGMNVFDHSLAEAAIQQLELRQKLGQASLASACQSCVLAEICASGYPPHRFSAQNNYDNPSVYCRDFQMLIPHIRASLLKYVDLPPLRAPDGSAELL